MFLIGVRIQLGKVKVPVSDALEHTLIRSACAPPSLLPSFSPISLRRSRCAAQEDINSARDTGDSRDPLAENIVPPDVFECRRAAVPPIEVM